MKKINFKQPKYIFPLIIFLPIVFLGYQIAGLFGGSTDKNTGVVSDSIMALPEAAPKDLKDKMSSMNDNFLNDGGYTAMGELGQETESKDSTQSDYSDAEMNSIDAENAKRKQQEKELQEMERSLAESRRRINQSSGYQGSRGSSRSDEMDDFASELKRIQERNKERQRSYDKALGISSDDEDDDIAGFGGAATGKGKASKKAKPEEKTEIVEKVKDANAEKFNTVGEQKVIDEPLIKAMIDQTTKAHDGTRLRFKLLDDVTIKKIKIKKGSYLYGTVTGFGQQRVMASITSILIKDKFIKVNLSVFDSDGMEGFYVPSSAFRDMMKNAGSRAMGSSINFNNGMGSELSAESVALQALQNVYQSASSALSANMRKNKARIKYNTVVYLINKSSNTDE